MEIQEKERTIKEELNSDITKDEYVFVDNADYAIAIGAYEYYLLRYRKP